MQVFARTMLAQSDAYGSRLVSIQTSGCDGTMAPHCDHSPFDFALLVGQCLVSFVFLAVASIRLRQLWRAKPVTLPSPVIYLKLVSPCPCTFCCYSDTDNHQGHLSRSLRSANPPPRPMDSHRRRFPLGQLVYWFRCHHARRHRGSYAVDTPGTKTLHHSVDYHNGIPPRIYALG